MADFNALEALINAYIKQNGVKAITGQVLNGVLRGMVSALGKGWTIADGDATPTTDPGTMTGPVAYIAHTAGTYEHFGNLVVNDGEVVLLKYNEQTWTKEVIASLAATATIDGNVGTPSVGVSWVNGVLAFDFRNMKGNTGDAAGFGTIGATVDGNIGTPAVNVQTSGPDTAKNITFAFRNLKGETGVTSVVATVDNTSGNPSCTVSLVGQELHLDFHGLKGAQGDTGVSADYPITIVNNLTTNDPASALSAAMGVQLEGEISQLELKVDGIVGPFNLSFITGQYISIPNVGETVGSPTALAPFSYSRIPAKPGDTVIVKGLGGSGPRLWAFIDANGAVLSRAEAGEDTRNNPAVLTVPNNTAEVIVNVNNGAVYEATYEASWNITEELGKRDKKISDLSVDKISRTPGRNIFTSANATSNKFIQSNGTLGSGLGYNVTNYLPVKAETDYFYSCAGVSNYPGGSGYINFYDSDFNLLSTSSSLSRSFTTPAGCAYIRATIKSDYNLYPMINEGTGRKEYNVFSPIGGFPKDGNKFASFQNEGEVLGNATFTGDGLLSNKSFFAVFEVYGTTTPLDFKAGFGKGSSYGAGVRITKTEMITYSGSSDTVAHTYEHGLVLSSRVRVVFSRMDDDWVNITLFDDLGNSFSGRNQNSHIGDPYITNLTENTYSVKMSQSSRDSDKPIVVCGDSYWSLKDGRRIPNHLFEWGYNNWELLARSGISGPNILPYLRAFIGSGARPKYIVWAMGMNGGADQNGAVNQNWLDATQEFLALCLNAGITPILCTIPSVPSEVHDQLNTWVKTSTFRYIDFSAAVSETGSYYWRGWGTDNALLSTDEVHPTAKGATILAERILLDFPEIAVL